MLDFTLLFKIGAAGILLVVLDKVLKASGKDEVATLANIAGVVLILIMVLSLINRLFDTVKTMFSF